VWCYGAQSYRPFGTSAEYVVVPGAIAVPLPRDGVNDQAACLGIAGITGYRALFADGPVHGLDVLVHGAAGGVGSIAVQMARRNGARVLATVRSADDIERVTAFGGDEVFLASDPDLAATLRAAAPEVIHRIAEIDFAGHIRLDAQILAVGGVISSYFSTHPEPPIPYWPLGLADITLRLLGSDDFRPEVKAHAASELTDALVDGALRLPVAVRLPLEQIAEAHELVERGAGGRVVLEL
jgi:NADPH2:quinone reductase